MTTNKEYIQKLLDSYMVAGTTKEEEKLLSEYFCTHQDIPAEWQNYSVMFRGLRQAKTRSVAFHKGTSLKWSAVAAAAASILLLLVLRFSQKPDAEQPVVAEVVEQPDAEPSEFSEASNCSESSNCSDSSGCSESSNSSEPAEPVKPKETYNPRKVSKPVEDPLLAEAEPVTAPTARDSRNHYEEKLSNPSNPYQLAVAQLQDLRSRGERLDREVAMLMQH